MAQTSPSDTASPRCGRQYAASLHENLSHSLPCEPGHRPFEIQLSIAYRNFEHMRTERFQRPAPTRGRSWTTHDPSSLGAVAIESRASGYAQFRVDENP